MRVFGTKVKNPCRRSWHCGYAECSMCHKWFTKLGISRHWDKCPKREPRG